MLSERTHMEHIGVTGLGSMGTPMAWSAVTAE